MSECAAVHPDHPEVTCILDVSPPHGFHTGRLREDGQVRGVSWPNEDVPQPKAELPRFDRLVAKTQPEVRSVSLDYDPIPTRAQAEVAKDEALERVEGAADPVWKAAANRFVVHYLVDHPTMFSDDLWDAGCPRTREERALGPIIKALAARGLCEKTGDMRLSKRSHNTEKPVWRSLIYRP